MRFPRSWVTVVLTLAAFVAPNASADPGEALGDLQSPQDVQAHYDAANRSIVLSWQAPENSSANTTYHVYRDGGFLGASLGLTFTDSALPNAAAWTYEVTAQNGETQSTPATLLVTNSAALSPFLNREPPIAFTIPLGNMDSPKSPIQVHGPPGTSTCTLIHVGWRPNAPYLFGFDWNCLEDLIGPI